MTFSSFCGGELKSAVNPLSCLLGSSLLVLALVGRIRDVELRLFALFSSRLVFALVGRTKGLFGDRLLPVRGEFDAERAIRSDDLACCINRRGCFMGGERLIFDDIEPACAEVGLGGGTVRCLLAAENLGEGILDFST